MKIKGLFRFPSGNYTPCGLTIWQRLWWRLVPGEIINVRWPQGLVEITEDHPLWDWTIGPSRYLVESADPNDHYRPQLEHCVGRQGWHWQWGMADRDTIDNRLTIKIVCSRAQWASYFAMKWA